MYFSFGKVHETSNTTLSLQCNSDLNKINSTNVSRIALAMISKNQLTSVNFIILMGLSAFVLFREPDYVIFKLIQIEI